MSKVTGPLFSLSASGSLGDALVFELRQGNKRVRFKFKRKIKPSLGQIAQRDYFKDAVKTWRTADPDVKNVWRLRGPDFKLSGYQLWIKAYHEQNVQVPNYPSVP